MIKKDLHGKLSHIVFGFSYDGVHAQIDESVVPNLGEKLGCISPLIILTKLDDGVIIEYSSASYVSILDGSRKKYYSKVSIDDSITVGLPLTRKNMIYDFISLFENDLYPHANTARSLRVKNLENVWQKEAEKKHTGKLFEAARIILSNLGTESEVEDDDLSTYTKCYYIGYGFHIFADYLPGHKYSSNPVLEPIPEKSAGHYKMKIMFNGDTVLDSSGTYKAGPWEETLMELYLACPKLREPLDRKCEEDAYKHKLAVTVDHLLYKRIKSIDDGYIRLGEYRKDGYDITCYGASEVEEHKYVKVDGEIVFDSYKSNAHSFDWYGISKYIPGEWEDLLQSYYDDLVETERRSYAESKEKTDQYAYKYAKRLRDLRNSDNQ